MGARSGFAARICRVSTTTTMLLALTLVLVAAPGVTDGSNQPPAASEDVVFVGAGDIANCDLLSGARATATLLDGIEGTIFTLGDHAYAQGTKAEFRECYEPTWGRHKARTRPTPGNHDYMTDRGRPYFDYFGAAAGSPKLGYYSFDLGAWHIISLNSSVPGGVPAQAKWLREDLAAHPVDCVLAYWHEPVYSSGPHTPEQTMHSLVVDLVQSGRGCRDERARPFVRAVRASGRQREAGCRRYPTVHRRHRWRRGVRVRKGRRQQRGAQQHDLRRVEVDTEPWTVRVGVCPHGGLAVQGQRKRCVQSVRRAIPLSQWPTLT